jgi:hypothetical protein
MLTFLATWCLLDVLMIPVWHLLLKPRRDEAAFVRTLRDKK